MKMKLVKSGEEAERMSLGQNKAFLYHVLKYLAFAALQITGFCNSDNNNDDCYDDKIVFQELARS